MKTAKNIFSYIIITFSWLGILYCIYWIKDPNTNKQVVLPRSTTQFIQINPKKLVNNLLLDIWFKNQDLEIINTLHAIIPKLNNINKSGFLSSTTNFDLTKPIYLVRCELAKTSILAIKGSPKNLKVLKYSEPLIYLSKTQDLYQVIKISREIKDFKKFKGNLLSNMVSYTVSNDEISFHSIKKNQISTSYSAEFLGNQILFHIVGENAVKAKKNILKKQNSFHYTTDLGLLNFIKIPKNKLMQLFKELKGISLNYYGADYINSDELFPIHPKFDAVLSFKSKVEIDNFQKLLKNRLREDIIFFDNYFELYKLPYFYKQIDSNSIYISSRQFNKNKIEKTNEFFVLYGKPKYLTEVRNLGWRGTILDMIPTYHSVDHFFQSIDKIDFVSGKNIANASIKFNNNLIPRIELLRLILALQFSTSI